MFGNLFSRQFCCVQPESFVESGRFIPRMSVILVISYITTEVFPEIWLNPDTGEISTRGEHPGAVVYSATRSIRLPGSLR